MVHLFDFEYGDTDDTIIFHIFYDTINILIQDGGYQYIILKNMLWEDVDGSAYTFICSENAIKYKGNYNELNYHIDKALSDISLTLLKDL